MAAITQKPIQRIRHHQDERLLAADLNADMAYEAMLSHLHVRGLHDTWGVALGLRLAVGTDGKAALVKPGLAYDCLGRELHVAEGIALMAPVRPAGNAGASLVYDLTVRYVDPQAKSPRQGSVDFCQQPAIRGLDFRWVLAGPVNHPASAWLAQGIRLGEEVPLARFILNSNGILSQPDYRFRRNARPLLRPHLAVNSVQPAWQADYEQVDDHTRLLRTATFTADINTQAGGFSQNTQYYVRLLSGAGLATLLAFGDLLGPLTSIYNPSSSGFSLRVTFGLVNTDPKLRQDLLAALSTEMEQARLVWMGAEAVTGCTPDVKQIFALRNRLMMILDARAITAMTYFGI